MLSFIRMVLAVVFLYSSRTVTKTELGARDWHIGVTDLTVLFIGGIWNTLGLWTRK